MEAETVRHDRRLEVQVTPSRREHDAALAKTLGSCRQVGYNPSGLTVARFRSLEGHLPEAEWIDVSSALLRARLVKDDEEISRVRKAAELSALTVGEIPSLLEPGITEIELGAEINFRLRKRGATGRAFSTIVAFGGNAAEPHHHCGNAELTPDTLVLVDLGARYRRYCSDLTRTFAFGEVGKTELRMHAVVSDAHEAALDCLIPGNAGRQVHEAAQRVIERTQFKGRFVHAIGHSVGLEAQDGAALHAHSDFVIEPGMVFAVEPGVYVPGVGGVRIEDTVLVTDRGAERLTDVSKELTTAC
jgi:Xaa-Pro dipeptidase